MCRFVSKNISRETFEILKIYEVKEIEKEKI